MDRYARRLVGWAVLAWFAFPSTVGAQAVSGALGGRVVDSSQSAVADAVVTLTHLETNAPSVTVTAADGTYRFTRVTPGRYSVSFDKSGFQKAVRDGLVIAVNEQAVMDAVLEVGALQDSVTVVAEVPLVQSQSAEVSGLVDERRVRELPLNGEN